MHESQEYEDMDAHHDECMYMVGAFLWLAIVTRFEIGYITAQLAYFVSNPGRIHFKAAVRELVHLTYTFERLLLSNLTSTAFSCEYLWI